MIKTQKPVMTNPDGFAAVKEQPYLLACRQPVDLKVQEMLDNFCNRG